MRLGILLCALVLIPPGPAQAQVGSSTPSSQRVGATAAILLKGSGLADSNRLLLGGSASLVFGDRFRVGGGGFALTENAEIPGSGAGSGFDLGAGYGGLFLGYWFSLPRNFELHTGLLFGAGHAEVRDRLKRQEVGAQNFLVAEPELTLSHPLFSRLHLGLGAGYRWVAGLDDLPRVSNDDLRSFTLTLGIRIGGP